MKLLLLILLIIVVGCSPHIRDKYVIKSVKMKSTKNGSWYEHKLEGTPLVLDSKELYSPGDTVIFFIKPKHKIQ